MAIRIVLVGKNKVGRTFVARCFAVQHNFKHLSLKDGVKNTLKTLYYYGAYKRIPWETQWRVYDALYKIDPDIWVGYLERRLRTTTRDVVVDDVRYENELKMLQGLGFITVRVTAPESRQLKHISNLTDAASGTVILQEWFNKDFIHAYDVKYSINNDTRDGTRKSVASLLEVLRATT